MAEKPESEHPFRPAHQAELCFNLKDEVARVMARPEWPGETRHAITLVKDAPLNVSLMVLKRGAQLAEHHTRGPVTVHVISGKIQFGVSGSSISLSPGQVIALSRNVVHSLEASEDSAILLSTAIS